MEACHEFPGAAPDTRLLMLTEVTAETAVVEAGCRRDRVSAGGDGQGGLIRPCEACSGGRLGCPPLLRTASAEAKAALRRRGTQLTPPS